MNNSMDVTLELLEVALQSLALRIPDVPVASVLMTRALIQLGREVASRFENFIRPYGFTEAEFRVLTTLYSQPEGMAHPGDLCQRASQSAANMSRICDELVSRNLITRMLSERDRRRMELRITAAGEAIVRDLLPKMFAELRDSLKDFTALEQGELTQQLKRLAAVLERNPMVEAAERTT